jgi:hypothetical protein
MQNCKGVRLNKNMSNKRKNYMTMQDTKLHFKLTRTVRQHTETFKGALLFCVPLLF